MGAAVWALDVSALDNKVMQCTAAIHLTARVTVHGRIANEQGSGLKEGVSARRRLTTCVFLVYERPRIQHIDDSCNL